MATVRLSRTKGEVDFHATGRVQSTVPVIEKEILIDGVRFYECEGGRTFRADIYDKIFKVTKGKIKGQRAK